MQRIASRRFLFSLLLTSLLLGLGWGSASAQDLDNVTITGKVMDQNNAVIQGAPVEAVLIKTGAARKVVSDAEGRYRIVQLEPGIYNLCVSSSGFAPIEKPELILVAGQNLQLDFTLFPQGVTVDPVLVTATDPFAVDTTRTVVGGTITTHDVESLPVGSRLPLDLIFTLPGVSEEPLST
ncbi:MAG: carboxypeptidase-like regulatory domain-containing protein, partial [bacterium]